MVPTISANVYYLRLLSGCTCSVDWHEKQAKVPVKSLACMPQKVDVHDCQHAKI